MLRAWQPRGTRILFDLRVGGIIRSGSYALRSATGSGVRVMAAVSGRFQQIDILRAVAALLVVWLHSVHLISPATPHGELVTAILAAVDPGRIGVVLFFVISGFVIPASLSGTRVQGARDFIIRRFFRLYPAYWLSIPIGLVPIWLDGRTVPISAIAANFSMIQNALGYGPIIGVYWTLETELAFYGICLVFFLLRIIDRPATFAWMILIAAAGEWSWTVAIRSAARAQILAPDGIGTMMQLAQYVVGDPRQAWLSPNSMFCTHLSVMAFGTLCRFWYDGKLQSRWGRSFLVSVAGFWTIIYSSKGVLYWYLGRWTWNVAQGTLSYSIAVAIFLLLVGVPGFSWRPLAYVGRISYSLYLFHAPLFLCSNMVIERWDIAGLAESPGVSAAFAIALSIGFSAFTYAVVETPAIDLGRRLIRSRGFGATAPEPSPMAHHRVEARSARLLVE